MITVACVVEGDGEVRALPALVRRVAETHGIHDVVVPAPFRLPRAKITNPAELSRVVELQPRRAGDSGGVLVLFDADDDCAVDLTKSIRASYAGGRQFGLVVAVREYESVLLAAQGIPAADAEAKRDAKGELRRLLGQYRETVHQARLSAALDIVSARECRWFRKFEKEVLAILRG